MRRAPSDDSDANAGVGRADDLFPAVYTELRRLAEAYFRAQPVGHTLQPTALVHEAYLRLSSSRDGQWNDRRHFYCVAARAMRQVLVNHARDRGRWKRGGGRKRVPIDDVVLFADGKPSDLLALDEALEALTRVDERKSRIVELRYFVGLSIEETARVLEVSPSTVKGEWAFSKAWLLQKLSTDKGASSGEAPISDASSGERDG